MNGYMLDTDLKADDWLEVIEGFKEAVNEHTGKPFPQDTHAQLWGAIGAVFGSWQNDRAISYRRMYDIPDAWGTAVNVQAMVFGNRGETSATGVAFTRNPSTGANGALRRVSCQCAGGRCCGGHSHASAADGGCTASRLRRYAPSLEALMPSVFAEFTAICDKLEASLSRHAGYRVHGAGRQAVDAADALGQAHDDGGH